MGVRAGLEVRVCAASVLDAVLSKQETVEDIIESDVRIALMEPRDRGFLLNIVLTALRRKGEIDAIIHSLVPRPLSRKSGLTAAILQTALAQLIFLGTPAHAVIDLSVEAARTDRGAKHFSGLVNAVLRKAARGETGQITAVTGAGVNTPQWLWQRWLNHYGADRAMQIAEAHLVEPFIDIAVKSEPDSWATKLGGQLLSPDHVRLPQGSGLVSELAGFSNGDWWVQDFAAGLPVSVMGNVRGKSVLDLCAAPGGKTMQLAAGGASVTAVDNSQLRLERLAANLRRTGLEARLVCADVVSCQVDTTFDAVLLDAPCSATGTIRRHPELPYLKSEAQIRELSKSQTQMLRAAAKLIKPGGLLIYCTCSLEPEEGEDQISSFLRSESGFELADDLVTAVGLPSEYLAGPGQVRTLPYMAVEGAAGLDGFYIAAMRRQG